jgi:hypothetical protein
MPEQRGVFEVDVEPGDPPGFIGWHVDGSWLVFGVLGGDASHRALWSGDDDPAGSVAELLGLTIVRRLELS